MRDKCIDKPPQKVLPISIANKIFRRRYVANTQYYFTDRKHAFKDSVEKKRGIFYKVPLSQKILSYIKYSKQNEKALTKNALTRPVHLKDSYKIAGTRDISQRLYIPEQENDIRTGKDLHPEFFRAVEGRPLRNADDVKVYITNIRQYAGTRQQIGYRRDMILKLDMNIVDERKEYEYVDKLLQNQVKNFQRFLMEDYKLASLKVEEAEMVHKEVMDKSSEYIGYVMQLTIVNNLIFKLDSIRGVLKIYRTFLLFAAPLYWREEFDDHYQTVLESTEAEFASHSDEFATDNDLVDFLDIDKIAESAKQELANPKFPHLYFTLPEEMMYLFRTMELQSREYLIQLWKTHPSYQMLMRRIKLLKQSTKQELDFSQYFIKALETEIDRELFNESYLRDKFMRILNEIFFDTIASPDTLKLKICIEYVYEQILGSCDEGHQNLREPMKILEVMYEHYNLLLDALDFKVVNLARKEFFTQDLKMLHEALFAQRVLREFNIMTKSINKSLMPPLKFKRPEFTKFKSKAEIRAARLEEIRRMKLASGQRMKRKIYKISPDDRDNLLFFTEWCEGMNPAPFLKHIDEFVKPVLAGIDDDNSSSQ